ncbi:arsenate reductase (glutaredoxin) [Endozoicomonas sp. SM1973]|uniref:Arsenate reductase n=1 Tax=Spartinivicinus marinus TaxID=2994442 RepID=A0A853IK45_9GAMM|nr:arsenate reductase (glutaredoxin) [Spartinivicinus marinus]MCX4028712.1 arsenate reductase (glutaredoxin) [Spartinivicinus marinus]NYZ68026.1 arsenate reductase (glutaredoxin) [Spartinivicinus marinus]
MSNVTIYHNPRCSKSRQTLQRIEAKNINPDIIRYLETPPTAAELKNILQLLGLSAKQLIRTSEAEYKTLALDLETATEDQLITAMVQHPKLIQRPIVIANGKAVLGRPPENVDEIL